MLNQGMFNALLGVLREIRDGIDDIRRATNRMDSRLKEHKQIVYLPPDADIAAFAEEFGLQDAIILPLPAQPAASLPTDPKKAGTTDPQAQMREMAAEKNPRPMPKTEKS